MLQVISKTPNQKIQLCIILRLIAWWRWTYTAGLPEPCRAPAAACRLSLAPAVLQHQPLSTAPQILLDSSRILESPERPRSVSSDWSRETELRKCWGHGNLASQISLPFPYLPALSINISSLIKCKSSILHPWMSGAYIRDRIHSQLSMELYCICMSETRCDS